MNSIDIGLIVLYLMLGVATVAAVILPIVSLFNNPKQLLKIAGGAAVFLLAFFLAYSVSDASVTTKWIAMGETGNSVKLIGAGLWMLYIFLFGSILVMIYSEVSKLFK
jgi:hypothetical protein